MNKNFTISVDNILFPMAVFHLRFEREWAYIEIFFFILIGLIALKAISDILVFIYNNR